MLRLVLECVAVVTLVANAILGPGFVGVMHFPPDRTHASSATPVSGASSVPATSPALASGTWYAPHGAYYGPASSASQTPQGRKPGEQQDLRTATSETFLNPDGTWTLKAAGSPIHYQDAQGHWQPIDTTLLGDTSDAGFAFGTKANAWKVHFAAQSGGPALVHAQFPQVQLTEALLGAASVRATISGSTIIYAGVLPGVTLLYQVGASALEETLLLQNAQVPTSFTFSYHVPGAAHVTQDAAGHLLFSDAKGALLLMIGSLLMYEADAQGRMQSHAAVSDLIPVTITGSGPDFHLTYTPDHAWLSDPARKFPVALDPTWQGGDSGQNTTSGNIYADTYIASANPDTIYWSVNSERIGNCTASGYGSGTNRTYIKFPINPAPAGVRVTSADLALYQSSQYTGGLGVAVTAGLIPSAWNATTLTWNTRPTGVPSVATAYTASTQNTWVHWDVTSAVYEWWQGGVALNGFEMRYSDETQACQLFFSDNNVNSQHPLLTINYVQDQTAPGGSLAYNGGATSTNNPAVTVTPTASDVGALKEWGSNWSTVNGVGAAAGFAGGVNSVDSAGTQLTADTSACGATACSASTYFTHPIPINNWPTFLAAFKTDSTTGFYFGVVSNDNSNTRFDVNNWSSGTNAFTSVEVSFAAGSLTSAAINIPLSPNTWYNGEVDFPLPTIGEIYIWPLGQARPSTPTIFQTGIYMTNPALNLFQYGNNGANLHHLSVGNVWMASKDTGSGTTGYGLQAAQYSSDGTSYGCPPYSGPSSFTGGPWCVYTDKSFPWTFTGSDGIKTLWYKYLDNAGNLGSGSATIIYDTTPPVVTGISPGNDSEVRGIVTVTVTGTDPTAPDGSSSGIGSALLYVDGVQAGTPVAGTTTPTFSWDTTNLPQGKHVLTAKVIDRAGNTSALSSFSNSVIVSNTALLSYETLAARSLPDHLTSVSVNVANGDTVVTHPDLDIPGRGPDLSLTRTYHALGGLNGLFGQGWTSEFDEHLTINGDGSVTYLEADGGLHLFLQSGSGGYLTSPGLFVILVKNGDGSYTLTSSDQTRTNFSSAGLLTSVVDRNGNTLTVSYTGGLPSSVTDVAGRTLTVTITGGHITGIAAPGARSYGYGYDGNGNLTDYTDPSGVVTHYTYDSSHRLLTITLNYKSGSGADFQTNVVTSLTYDTVSSDFQYNRLTQLLDPLGYAVTLSYRIPAGGSALQTQVQQQQGISPVTYETTTYVSTTDGLGAVAKLTDPANNGTSNATQYLYDAQENLTQVTDPDGHVTQFSYDSSNSSLLSRGNRLSEVVDPGSSPHLALTTTWSYDSANNVLTLTDPRGIVTQYTYDTPTTGNLTKVVADYVSGGANNSDTNVTTTSTYDGYGEVLTSTDPLGIVTKYSYDTYGNVLSTIANYVNGGATDSQTNVTSSATYDVLGEVLTATKPAPTDPIPQYVVTQYGYYILGHVIQTVANYSAAHLPNEGGLWNLTTIITYDALGRPLTTTNPRGYVTKIDYDADGRTLDVIQNYVSGGAQDVQTNVKAMAATYDAAGNTLTQTDAAYNTPGMNTPGHKTTTTYDLDNRSVQVKVQDNATPTPNTLANSATKYDVAGFVIEKDTLKADNSIQYAITYGYDGAGRQVTQTDPPAVVPDPGGSDPTGVSNVTTTTYDAEGNVLEVKMTNSRLASAVSDATSSFDKLNRPLTKTEQANTASAQTTTNVYDADGQLTSVTDPTNKTTTDAYDALGRVLTITHPDTTQDTFTYYPDGKQKTKVNSAGTTSDTYDALGRVISEVSGSPQTTSSFTYDANGNKLTEIDNYPGGTSTTITWTYDPLDRQATMNDGIRSFTYNVNGAVTQVLVTVQGIGNAVEADMTYDGASRLATLLDKVSSTGSTLHSYSYQYDLLGNRSQITEDGTTTTYQYDQLNQLTKVTQGATTVTYKYDANNNRISMQTASGTTTYSYDAADVTLLSKTDPSGKVTTYSYDLVSGKSNGNLVQTVYDPGGTGHLNQTTTYTYDTNNRLKTVQLPSGTLVTFAYDANGNRVSKAVTAGGTTTTVLDVYAQGRLAYQTDGSGNKIASFNYDRSGVPESVDLTTSAGIVRYYYVYNGHGDVVALVDANGTAHASYSFDEFGVPKTSSESFPNNTSNWTNPYRYDGAERVRYDSETGLYWMSVRAYDPTLGRFISHDPLGRLAAQGLDFQPYVYAANNPLNKTDPSGMWSLSRVMLDGEYAAPMAPIKPAPTGMNPTKPTPRCWIAEVCHNGHRLPNPPGCSGKCPQIQTPIKPKTAHPDKAKDALIDGSIYFAAESSRISELSSTLDLVGIVVAGLGAIVTSFSFFTLGLTALIGVPLFAIGANIEAAGRVLDQVEEKASTMSSMLSNASNHSEAWFTDDNIYNLFHGPDGILSVAYDLRNFVDKVGVLTTDMMSILFLLGSAGAAFAAQYGDLKAQAFEMELSKVEGAAEWYTKN
jgi:RHS repeat-associated protein